MNRAVKVLFVQRVAAEYRSAFFCCLADKVQLKVLRGVSKGMGDVVDAHLPPSIDDVNHVKYFFNGRIWLHTNILKAVREYKPDVVIVSPTARDLTNLALFVLRRRYGFRIIGWGMGAMPGRNKIASRLHEIFQKYITDRLDALIVYSSEARRYYKERLGFTNEIEVASNAVDLSAFSDYKKKFENESIFTLVYVGRIIKEKKLEQLIDVVLERSSINLKLVGSGHYDYIDFLKSKIGNHHDRIEFIGPLYEAALNKFLMQCDLFVLPSRGGLAINHAMASGLPVLVSIGDGTEKDLIMEAQTGFIFQDGDFEMMAECIDKLKTDPELLQRVARQAAIHVRENFSVENMCGVFEEVIGKLR